MPRQIQRDGFASDAVFTEMPNGTDPTAAREEKKIAAAMRRKVALENVVEAASDGNGETAKRFNLQSLLNLVLK